MNLIDLFIILIVAIAVLEGVYRGFINSVSRIGAFFLSWITAFLFSPALAGFAQNQKDFFNYLITYVDVTEQLGNIENAKLLVGQIKETDLNAIISNANLPQPFPALIKDNVVNKAFESKGLTTLGQYANETIVCTIVNILCFLAIFLIATFLFIFIINALDRTLRFPVLRQFDGLLGGGFGLILGCFTLFVVFLVVPIILVMMEVKLVSDYLNSSFLGSFFYKSNFFMNFIRGVI
jgi:uncharacterized membrane protein required for colicin V production